MAIDPNYLALLANELGGVERLALESGASIRDIYNILDGRKPSSKARVYALQSFINELENGGLDDELGIDLDEINERKDYADEIQKAAILDDDMRHNFRAAIANGNIPAEMFDVYSFDDKRGGVNTVLGIDFFYDLTLPQAQKVLDFAASGGDLSGAFNGYEEDGGRIFTDDIQDSGFWAWYRENIYGDINYNDR